MAQPISCIPVMRTQKWWLERHQQKLHEKVLLSNQADIVLIGDSIMHEWEVEGFAPWQHYFKDRSVLNLGFAGDCTEHVLWRLEHGELDNFVAKHIVVLIGTNNAGHRKESANDIALGIMLICEKIKDIVPAANIVLMAIFPRSRHLKKQMRILVNNTS